MSLNQSLRHNFEAYENQTTVKYYRYKDPNIRTNNRVK